MYHKYVTLLANDKILDLCFPPSAIDPPPNPNKVETFPTEARLKQKARLKEMKEQGVAPKKRNKEVEAGNDDCGDDLSGLGNDIKALYVDVPETIFWDTRIY